MAARYDEIMRTSDTEAVLSQLHAFDTYLEAKRLRLEQKCLERPLNHVIQMPALSTPEQVSMLCLRAGNLSRRSCTHLGMDLVASAIVEHHSAPWLEVFAQLEPDRLLSPLLANNGHFDDWIKSLTTTPQTLSLLAQCLVQATLSPTYRGTSEKVIVALDKIHQVNPDIVGPVCVPAFLKGVHHHTARNPELEPAVSGLARASLGHIAEARKQVDEVLVVGRSKI